MAKDPKAKEAAPAAAGDAPPKKSKKKLFIIIGLVVVLLGGGAGGFFYMKAQEEQHKKAAAKKAGAHEAGAEADSEEAAAEEEGGGGHGAGPVFVTLETFTVNLQPDPDEKFLQLDLSLQVKKAEEGEVLKGQMPAIRNRLLLLLSSKKASDISTMEGKEALTKEILVEVNKPLSEHGKPLKVKGVFFTSFVIQ